jgi:hypothetical protein
MTALQRDFRNSGQRAHSRASVEKLTSVERAPTHMGTLLTQAQSALCGSIAQRSKNRRSNVPRWLSEDRECFAGGQGERPAVQTVQSLFGVNPESVENRGVQILWRATRLERLSSH